MESRLNRDAISAGRLPPAAPPATAAVSLDGRASWGARMAVRRRRRKRARITNITAPATLPTTPPTILLVVGGIDGPPVGGGEASVPVDVGPVVPVFPDPPPPNPSIHRVDEGSKLVVAAVVPVIEDAVEEGKEEVTDEGKEEVGFVLDRDIRLGLEVKADEADKLEALADGMEDDCAGNDDGDELISGRDVVAEAVGIDDTVEVVDVKPFMVRLGVSAVSEL